MFGMASTQDSSPLKDHPAAHGAELVRAFSESGRNRILSALVGQAFNVTAVEGQVRATKTNVPPVRQAAPIAPGLIPSGGEEGGCPDRR